MHQFILTVKNVPFSLFCQLVITCSLSIISHHFTFSFFPPILEISHKLCSLLSSHPTTLPYQSFSLSLFNNFSLLFSISLISVHLTNLKDLQFESTGFQFLSSFPKILSIFWMKKTQLSFDFVLITRGWSTVMQSGKLSLS